MTLFLFFVMLWPLLHDVSDWSDRFRHLFKIFSCGESETPIVRRLGSELGSPGDRKLLLCLSINSDLVLRFGTVLLSGVLVGAGSEVIVCESPRSGV